MQPLGQLTIKTTFNKTLAIMETQLTKELYVSPIKEQNIERYGQHADMCECCGKRMKEGEGLWVHMNTDWLAVNPLIVNENNIEELTGAGSQGCFRIGNDCAKKMKGFTFKI